jgi:hypothetical protein
VKLNTSRTTTLLDDQRETHVTPDAAMRRRSFLARGAAVAAVPAVATLAGGALADRASAAALPDFVPIPPSALGPAVNAQGYVVRSRVAAWR